MFLIYTKITGVKYELCYYKNYITTKVIVVLLQKLRYCKTEIYKKEKIINNIKTLNYN